MSRAAFPVTVGTRPFTVRVAVGRGLVSCQWRGARVPGKKRRKLLTKSWPDSPANRATALAYAKDYAAERQRLAKAPAEPPPAAPARLTLGELWERYKLSCAHGWRPKTARNYASHAKTLLDVLHENRAVEDTGLDEVDAYRAARRAGDATHGQIAHGQVRREIGFLRQLATWAYGRGLTPANRLSAYRYRVPLDERTDGPGEYTRADLLAVAAELGKPQHWRARGAIALCGSLGARINAVLHLTWDDVDFAAGTVTWRAEWDKLGRVRVQPLTTRARAALTECLEHRHATEAWVFWAVRTRGRPYAYQSLHYHLTEAEDRAHVTHLPGRGFDGLRRMVVGDIGDLRAAAAWIGDSSLKVVAGSYLKQRASDVETGKAAIEGIEK